MKVNSSKVISMDKERINGKTVANLKVTIITISWKVTVSSLGSMEEYTKEITKVIRKVGTVYLNGLMVESTMEIGRMASNMEKVTI